LDSRRREAQLERNVQTILLVTVACTIFGAIGCKSGRTTRRMEQPRVPYSDIENPARELCMDDSESPTPYFDVHVARFEGSEILLDEKLVTPKSLREWVLREYGNMPEQVLRVQFKDEDEQVVSQALRPLVKAMPNLHVRRAPFSFSCPKL
jgi:hypothetical protein